uniref:Uncharacterized protein n=1 Tax=Plesiomonas shigelloides TaxID=703 RepID=A0A4D6U7A7_PLESH|nr:hypothetical protein [Plesiomonas shigelloides]
MTLGTVHCHINNELMGIEFSGVVLKTEQDGFQVELAAMALFVS